MLNSAAAFSHADFPTLIIILLINSNQTFFFSHIKEQLTQTIKTRLENATQCSVYAASRSLNLSDTGFCLNNKG